MAFYSDATILYFYHYTLLLEVGIPNANTNCHYKYAKSLGHARRLWIPRIIGFIVVTLVLVSIRRRREAIRHRIRRIIIVEGVYIGVAYALSQLGRTGIESLARRHRCRSHRESNDARQKQVHTSIRAKKEDCRIRTEHGQKVQSAHARIRS
jgi:hypothetical protein